jgi:hypothetical protein
MLMKRTVTDPPAVELELPAPSIEWDNSRVSWRLHWAKTRRPPKRADMGASLLPLPSLLPSLPTPTNDAATDAVAGLELVVAVSALVGTKEEALSEEELFAIPATLITSLPINCRCSAAM